MQRAQPPALLGSEPLSAWTCKDWCRRSPPAAPARRGPLRPPLSAWRTAVPREHGELRVPRGVGTPRQARGRRVPRFWRRRPEGSPGSPEGPVCGVTSVWSVPRSARRAETPACAHPTPTPTQPSAAQPSPAQPLPRGTVAARPGPEEPGSGRRGLTRGRRTPSPVMAGEQRSEVKDLLTLPAEPVSHPGRSDSLAWPLPSSG